MKHIRVVFIFMLTMAMLSGAIFSCPTKEKTIQSGYQLPTLPKEHLRAENFFSIELRVAYFQPSEAVFRDIYKAGITYGAEINLKLWKWLKFWIAADYYAKKGKLTLTEEETEIQILPLSGGLKLQFPGTRLNPYIGFGVGYFFYKESSPIGEISKGDIGYIGQGGCLLKLFGPLFIDLKIGYTYCEVEPVNVKADLGGIQGGIGIGLQF